MRDRCRPSTPSQRWIVKAALTTRPKTRYRIGPGANIAVALATLLPDRTFEAMTRKQFGYA
ncbi:hypothetical protein M2317_000781 [Microbacterium sp. ZKA21]|uniref:hypothetical protein n=1 Tax=Microbacterium sp. ZKA21 TaxID=3381694 RepID=UPI003D1DDB4A